MSPGEDHTRNTDITTLVPLTDPAERDVWKRRSDSNPGSNNHGFRLAAACFRARWPIPSRHCRKLYLVSPIRSG